MSDTKVMRCELQDYIEIACLFRYEVELENLAGEVVIGRAVTTRINSQHQECLVLDSVVVAHTSATKSSASPPASPPVSSAEHEIELSQLRQMRVLTKNARFRRVDFLAS